MYQVSAVLVKCEEGIDLVRSMEENLYKKNLVAISSKNDESLVKGNPGIVRLESSLLSLGATYTACKGLFYMLPVELPDCVIVRFMEAGCYSGFYKIAEQQLKEHFGDKPCMPWRVYTQKDFSLETPSSPPTNIAEAFNRRVGGVKKAYTHSIMNQLQNLKDSLKESLFVVHTLRVGNKPNHKLGR